MKKKYFCSFFIVGIIIAAGGCLLFSSADESVLQMKTGFFIMGVGAFLMLFSLFVDW